jgi:hypothetical protein
MRYLLIIYALFILAFDFYSDGSQVWTVVYYTVQYVFAGSVALYFVFRGRQSVIPFVLVAAFFYTMAIFELSMLRFDQSEYFYHITEPKAQLSCGIVFIIIALLLIILRKKLK